MAAYYSRVIRLLLPLFCCLLFAADPQTIDFPAIPNQTVGSVLALSATASSDLPISFRVAKGPASIIGNNLTIHGRGHIMIAAIQTGDIAYSPAVRLRSFLATGGTAIWRPLGAPGRSPWSMKGAVRVAAGNRHVLVIRQDGMVSAWGDNRHGQCDVPGDLERVTEIAAGDERSLALCSDGRVVEWGDVDHEVPMPDGLGDAIAISAGAYVNLALRRNGSVVAWGDNHYGDADVPAGLANVTAIASGWGHALALQADGTVRAWGDNAYGQTDIPLGLSGVKAIAAGHNHSVALLADGSVVTWGSTLFHAVPMPPALTGVVAIAAGAYHTLALRADGTVVAWGGDSSGELPPPSGLSDVARICASGYNSLALTHAGDVITWGDDIYGQTLARMDRSTAAEVAPDVARGIGLREDGSLLCWGYDTVNDPYEVPIGLSNVIGISFQYNAIAVRGDGTARAWGTNYVGESTPPADMSGVCDVAVGYDFGSALLDDGTIRSWGAAACAAPVGLDNVIAIAAGQINGIALRYDGTVHVWGAGDPSSYLPPAGLTDVVAIAAASQFLALRSDGTVTAWGNNLNGQCDVPSGLTGVSAISCAGTHSLAMRSDGSLVTWGTNFNDPATPERLPQNAIAISAGGLHSWAFFDEPIEPTITLLNPVSVADGLPRAARFSIEDSYPLHEVTYDGSTIPPSAPGTYAVTAKLDCWSARSTWTGTMVIDPAVPVITSPATATSLVDSPFAYRITATSLPESFAATRLPPGLSLDPASGWITGTPTEVGSYKVTISATHGAETGTAWLTLNITNADGGTGGTRPTADAGSGCGAGTAFGLVVFLLLAGSAAVRPCTRQRPIRRG